MAKVKVHFPSLYDEMKEIFDDFENQTLEAKERGLNKAADYLVNKYEQATPAGESGKTKLSWFATKKYKNVKYINNTALSKDGIPIVNLLEFSKNGKPFMRATFEREKGKLIDIITEELKK